MSLALVHPEASAISRTRERFVAGSDSLEDIRPVIALSWLRCRDRYAVDPGLAFAPRATPEVRGANSKDPDRYVVLTRLSRLAALVHERLGSGVVTVVDADGQLVDSWGGDVPGAPEANLAPRYSWSEATTGTNGMGTALRSDGVTAIRGPEHWCKGFQSLDCLGVAIQDPVTRSSVGAINVSCPTGTMPGFARPLLQTAARTVDRMLHDRARHHGLSLVEAYHAAAADTGRSVPTLALDVGGNVVVADEAAAALLDIPSGGPRIDPSSRARLPVTDLDDLVATAVTWARHSHGWSGTGELPLPDQGGSIETTFTAVMSAGSTVGFLVSIGTAGGDPFNMESIREPWEASRIVAERPNGRTLLLHPGEIRYARADGNIVWLDTDHGRVRAAERGLATLERRLQAHGFQRVHRGYLVNLRRVREVGRGAGQELLLFMDGIPMSPVPVSRARAKRVRASLGL